MVSNIFITFTNNLKLVIMKTYKTIDDKIHHEPENLQDRISLVVKVENMLGVYSLIQHQTKEDVKSIISEIPERFKKTIMYKKLASKYGLAQ